MNLIIRQEKIAGHILFIKIIDDHQHAFDSLAHCEVPERI